MARKCKDAKLPPGPPGKIRHFAISPRNRQLHYDGREPATLKYNALMRMLAALLLMACWPMAALAINNRDITANKNGAINLAGMTVTADVENAKTLGEINVTANVWAHGMIQVGPSNPIRTRPYQWLNRVPSTDIAKNVNSCPEAEGDPILTGSGTKVETYTLFALPGEMGLKYELYYNTARRGSRWADNLSYFLDTECSDMGDVTGQCNFVSIYRPDGSKITFAGGPKATTFREASSSSGVVSLTRNASSGVFTFRDEDGTTQVYSPGGVLGSIVDAFGIGWTITISSDSGGGTGIGINPVRTAKIVTHTNGQSYAIRYNHTMEGSQATVTDPAGNSYIINNIDSSALESITLPGNPSTTIGFRYTLVDGDYRLSEVRYNGQPYAYTTYITDPKHFRFGWANGTRLADGSQNVSIAYGLESKDAATASITSALGHFSKKTFDGRGNLTLISNAATQACGATTQGRSYDTQGNLATEIDNNGNTHTYRYASNGQLLSETEAYGTPLERTTDYEWDPDQKWNRLRTVTVRGWQKTSYAYNASQRLASESVTNLSSNGVSGQTLTTSYDYTLYGNGMVQSITVTRPSPSGQDKTTRRYDTYGNLTTVTNGLGHTTTYSNYNGLGQPGRETAPNGDMVDYTYDPRGRLSSKTAYANGGSARWSYAYDGYGLLASTTGPDGESTTWNRDSRMWVTSIVRNDKDGASTESIDYDADGNVLRRTISRGGATSLVETRSYDALGRLYRSTGQNGQVVTHAYDGNGNVLSTADAVGHTVSYQYDALDRVTARMESGGASPAMPGAPPNLNLPGSSTNGAYTVSWTSITGALNYALQEKAPGGAWTTVQAGPGLSWQTAGRATGAYLYQAKACNATGCSAWSNPVAINVTIPSPPTLAPSLSVPSTSATGEYNVSWSEVANGSTYHLQEQVNGGSWNSLQNGSALSRNFVSRSNGSYGYRVQACNSLGCGPWSVSNTIVVNWPPVPGVPAAPASPSYSATGAYSISWSPVPNATSYRVYEIVNGNWTGIYGGSATSYTLGGRGNGLYMYTLQACNISGCSNTGAASSTTVIVPTPIAANGQTYQATRIVSSGTANQGIGFSIANGSTWEVFKTQLGNSHVVMASGPMPYGATRVQYTWTFVGPPSGATDGAGSITNDASSQQSVSSNPWTYYVTGNAASNSGTKGREYRLRIDFFDDQGRNVSSSTCTMIAETQGLQG